MAIGVRRLNHAVLYVSELERAVAFYRDVFGFEEIARLGDMAAFMRAGGSDNHHDLGLFAKGRGAPRPDPRATGLYHLAWQVDRIDDLAAARDALQRAGALVGQSDHGATKSLYGKDPDGNEFEIMWMVPREEWGRFEREAPVMPLDLERELARYGSRG